MLRHRGDSLRHNLADLAKPVFVEGAISRPVPALLAGLHQLARIADRCRRRPGRAGQHALLQPLGRPEESSRPLAVNAESSAAAMTLAIRGVRGIGVELDASGEPRPQTLKLVSSSRSMRAVPGDITTSRSRSFIRASSVSTASDRTGRCGRLFPAPAHAPRRCKSTPPQRPIDRLSGLTADCPRTRRRSPCATSLYLGSAMTLWAARTYHPR